MVLYKETQNEFKDHLLEGNILQDTKSILVITELWQVKGLQDISYFLKA